MTVTDPLAEAQRLSDDDLLLLTEPEPTRRRDRSEPPPGAEAMARPWRLGIVGLGVTIGLIARLLAANGYFSINSSTLVYAATATSLLAGIGLIALAAERDRFDRWMLLLAAGTGLSLGALQWVSPHFAPGTLEWSNATQFALALLGVSNGLLLAGVLTLAFVRRWPTMTVVSVLTAGVLTLGADSVLLRNEWPAIAALALAFGGVLLAWDQAPRHEPTYPELSPSPRISRAALSLATVALGGSVLQLSISRGESVRRVLPAAILSAVLIALAFLALVRIRREIQRRETSTNEWTSWMREIRTGDLRSDFDALATTASGGVVGDVTGEVPRSLSFPDLRVDEPTPAEVSVAVREAALAEGPDDAAPAIDIPGDALIPAIPVPDVASPAEPVQARLFGNEPADPSELLIAREDQTSADLLWADDLNAAASEAPVVGDDQPSLFDFERELVWADQAVTDSVAEATASTASDTSSFTDLLAEAPGVEPAVEARTEATPVEQPVSPAPIAPVAPQLSVPDVPPPAVVAPPPAAASAPTSASSPFSSWLGQPGSVPSIGSIGDVAAWLATASGPTRLVVAVETMSLADFDELPAEVSAAANAAMLERLGALTTAPDLVAAIDGPYLMAAWNHVGSDRLVEINRIVLDAMSTPVPTEHGAVGLTGTLALLRPAEDATLDALIDQAIHGLVQARQLEALAARHR